MFSVNCYIISIPLSVSTIWNIYKVFHLTLFGGKRGEREGGTELKNKTTTTIGGEQKTRVRGNEVINSTADAAPLPQVEWAASRLVLKVRCF